MKLAWPGLALLALGGAIAAWLVAVDPVLLRLQLIRWQFWMLEAQALLLVGLSILNVPRLWRSLALPPAAIRSAAAAGALSLVLGGLVAPRTNRIYYDEHIYQGIGQNLADLHLAQMCHDGTVEGGSLECWSGEYNKEPYGYPYLLSVGYRFFGTRTTLAHRLNLLCSAALVLVVFLVAAALFGDPRAAVAAAFVTALIPQQVLWAPTAAVEPSAALMTAVAVLAAVHHARERSTPSLLWVVAASAFAAQFRPEAALVIPVAALTLLVLAPGELAKPRLWWAAVLGLLLLALHVGHLAAIRHEQWGAAGAALSLDHLRPNLRVNGAYYFDHSRFPVLFTMFAFFGATARPVRQGLVPLAGFLAFWGVFLFFYAGSYDFGADVRYSLMSNAWLAVLAGRGASWLGDRARIAGVPRRARMAAAIAAFGVPFSWFLPRIRSVGEEAWAARADIAFAEAVMPELPGNSIVFTHNPSVFLVAGRSAAQISVMTSNPGNVVAVTARRFAGGVFLHWNAWCGYPDPVQQEFCAAALRVFSSEVFREYRERDFRYAFYRLHVEGTVPKAAP